MTIGIVLLTLVSTPVVLSILWLPYDVNAMDPNAILTSPSIRHVFGTDNFGRDIFCRVVEGTRATFLIALFTVICGAGIGSVIGALTGYFGGIADEILMRVNDCLASFPSILLALVVVSLLDKGVFNVCIALGIVFIPSFARITRSEYIEQSRKDYVLSAKLMRASDFRIIFIHIYPNAFPAILSAMLLGLNNAVLAEAGLSYLGLGVEPPDPSLGRMLSEAQVYIWGAPWYVVFTSVYMIIMILGISLVSENIGKPKVNTDKVKKEIRKKRADSRNKAEAASSVADSGVFDEVEDRRAEEAEAEGTSSVAESGVFDEGEGRGAEETEAEAASSVADSGVFDEVEGRGAEEREQPEKLLDVRNLKVGFISDDGIREVINGISFSLIKGEILGIVGESGSGKSMTALSIMGVLPETAAVTGGSILFEGRDLADIEEDDYCRIRGRDISMIFQEPMTALNPLKTIGEQIDEVLDLHASQLSAGEQRQLVIAAMADTGLKDPDSLYNKYPHELSGGMRQRVMIAMAVIGGAKVIIADEPTTALDAGLADVILEIFRNLNKKYGTGIILISHDLEVIAKICGRALIMHNGIFEEEIRIHSETDGSGSDMVFEKPVTDYGKRLLEAAYADSSYVERTKSETYAAQDTRETIMKATDYSVFYRIRNGLFGKKKLKQVNFNINMEIRRGDCAGIVGESGCGKTTFVKGVAGLQKYTTGKVELKDSRPAFVFQDPLSSLNPSKTVGWILEEELKINTDLTKEERKEKIFEILEAVELDKTFVERKVTELSGGQRQRVSIASGIILKHDLIILDEPVSALDVTIREQILELLMRLKKERDLTFIIISHDRRLISRVCNRIFHMENGKIL